MAYDLGGFYITYKSNVEQDIGAGVGTAWSFKGPNGYKGRIVEMGAHITETFTATTTPGYIRAGTGADADAYAEMNMGVAADTNTWTTNNDTDAIIAADIAANAQVEVTHVAPTGGSPAGKCWPFFVVYWYK